jgi:erythromycin esterase-like protein
VWRNSDVVGFVEWLRAFNAAAEPEQRVGFYGLDLYSLHDSIAEVLRYLATVDPEAAGRARARYACFDHFGEDTQAYGYASAFGMTPSCEQAVVSQLVELRGRAADYVSRDGRGAEDALFYAEQNARLVKNAEEYYRTMFAGRVSSWNLRDTHMADTLDALASHLERDRPRAKIVAWAHNSHLGDARATSMGDAGELNLGELTRKRHGGETVLVGLTTYDGTVTAAADWDEPAERKRVRPALGGSWEAAFHGTGLPRFLLAIRDDRDLRALLAESQLERAIGVVYRPQTERASHYFDARLARQFDAVLHFDTTRALQPLEPTAEWHAGEVPETFPTGV